MKQEKQIQLPLTVFYDIETVFSFLDQQIEHMNRETVLAYLNVSDAVSEKRKRMERRDAYTRYLVAGSTDERHRKLIDYLKLRF